MSGIIDFLLTFSGSVIAVFVIIIALVITRWIFKKLEKEIRNKILEKEKLYNSN